MDVVTKPIHIGTRLELFVDRVMADVVGGGATLRLHRPVAREIALRADRPWEGNASGYLSVFRDTDRVRMYYKGCHFDIVSGSGASEEKDGMHWRHPYYVAYAESLDGIHFHRPNLGRVDYCNWSGRKIHAPRDNNIVMGPSADGAFSPHGFTAFRDGNPAAPETERYKAVAAKAGSQEAFLYALTSPDGIDWTLRNEPILDISRIENEGTVLDSPNLVFWDSVHGCYRAYMRTWHPEWHRYIATATSTDFITWSEAHYIELPGATPHELYTNQVLPYPRAPHLLIGFPTRYVQRTWCYGMERLPDVDQRRQRANVNERYGTAITEGMVMAGRDGTRFHMWDEAFLRPGPQISGSWAYGDQYQAWGIIETPSAIEDAPPELSFYAVENYFIEKGAAFRRYTMRLDGFVSVNAPLAGGTVLTPAVIFDGAHLQLNIETSAAGGARVQLETPEGIPIPGFTLDDCHEVFGDQIAYPVAWRDKTDCTELIGMPVRLRVALRDADLYAFQFSRTPVRPLV